MSTEAFNPLQFKGREHYTLHALPTHLHVRKWIEVDRNAKGNVTVIAPCFVNNQRGTTLEFNEADLLTLEQLQERLNQINATGNRTETAVQTSDVELLHPVSVPVAG